MPIKARPSMAGRQPILRSTITRAASVTNVSGVGHDILGHHFFHKKSVQHPIMSRGSKTEGPYQRAKELVDSLVVAGCFRTQDIPQFPSLLQTAQSRTRGLPRVVEIRYRHDILPGEEFVMKPGFENLDPVRNGDLLPHDRHGENRSRETGYILMPLYQSQGNDGFFLVRRVRPFWLRLPAWLRAIGAGNVLQYLPGVQRRGNDTLTINSKIARWFVVEIFHLLGFRRQRPENGIQVFTRRPRLLEHG
jgi:hypothetical protein